MVGTILYLLLVGLIAGVVARLVVRLIAHGRSPLGFWGTVLLGAVGSFVGGFLGYALFDEHVDQGPFHTSGIFGSIIGAIIALLIYRAITKRQHRFRPGVFR
jgi:uncharacterized membrane protein YeaQ/YmgE (transglycosylase-associated protein family)